MVLAVCSARFARLGLDHYQPAVLDGDRRGAPVAGVSRRQGWNSARNRPEKPRAAVRRGADDARQSRGRADDRGGAHLSRCARRVSVEFAVLQSQPRYARRPDSGLVWRLPEGQRTALYTGAEIHGRIVHLRPARQIARLADGGERGDWRDPVEIPFAAADGDVGDDDLSRPGVYR